MEEPTKRDVDAFVAELFKCGKDYKKVSPMFPPRTVLAGYLRVEGLKQSDLADRLGVVQASVSNWLTATTVPDVRIRPAIHRLLSISPERWNK